jgi:hypothetical protein
MQQNDGTVSLAVAVVAAATGDTAHHRALLRWGSIVSVVQAKARACALVKGGSRAHTIDGVLSAWTGIFVAFMGSSVCDVAVHRLLSIGPRC